MLFPMGGPPGPAASHLTLCPSILEREVELTFQFSALRLWLVPWERALKHDFPVPSQPGVLSVTLRELRREKAGVF